MRKYRDERPQAHQRTMYAICPGPEPAALVGLRPLVKMSRMVYT